jgi:hypothetical protein
MIEIGDYIEVNPSGTYVNDPPLRGIVLGYGWDGRQTDRVRVKLDLYPQFFLYPVNKLTVLNKIKKSS